MFAAIIRHGILVSVITLILLILGIAAIWRIPVQMIPDLETRVVGIETQWPGATPQDIEKDILIEQEEFLRNVPNLQRMESTASSGSAEIELEFPFGVDLTETLIRVNNALSQVPSYPNNVDQPRIVANSFSANAFMYFNVGPREGNPRQLDMPAMRDYLEVNVRPRLESVAGVSEVTVSGGAERQMQLLIDPEALAARELSIADIQAALQARNQDVSGGNLESGKRRYLLRTVGRFEDVESLEALILIRDGDAVTRLSDVAVMRQSYAELTSRAYSSDGQPVLSVQVRREPGANVIDIKRAMLDEVAALNEGLLAEQGMRMTLSSDDVRYVESSIANVWVNLGLGALFATLVMYAFLRSARSTFVAAVAIPICTIAAFIGLLLAGRTLNVISMAGVAFAIGMTLDNTIVVLESIDQSRRRGLKPFDAAVAGVSRVWPAVLACTLTTVLVFAPTLFIQEEAGQLYSDIAIAICASILASMAVAVTVLPAMAAWLLPQHPLGTSAEVSSFDQISRWISKFYSSSIRRAAVLSGMLGAAVCTVLWLTPPAEYLPEGEEARIFSRMIAPPGYNLTEMEGIAQELIPELQQRIEDVPERFHQGETNIPAMRFFTMFVDPQGISIITDPKDPGDIDALMVALEARFTAWPGMRSFASRGSIISSNDGGTRSINLNVSGSNLSEIYQVAGLAYARAETLFDNAQISSEPSSLSLDQSQLEIRPRWERLAEVGLDADRFGYSVAALSDGAFADEMILDDRRVDIYLFSSAGSEQQVDRFRALPVATPSGTVLPLSALADLHESADTDSIRRLNGRRTVTLNIIPPRSVALETGVERVSTELIESMRTAGEIPHGISMDITGASDQLQATREAVSGNFMIAVLLCYLMLVAVFRHWGRPLFVMATIPLGLAGGIIGLTMLNRIGAHFGIHQPLDMITLLGFLVLLGAVVNNPILIVQEAYKRLEEGAESITSAVEDAVRIRLRAILMSSLTTILGVAPLVLIPGAGTELYRGLGAIVMFGIAFSSVVTLSFLPSLIVTIISWQKRLAGRASQWWAQLPRQ